jgi:hypothetical protein
MAMSTSDQPTGRLSLSRCLESISFARLLLFGVAVTVGLASLAVGIPWMIALTPRWLVRVASITFLWTLLAGFVVAVPVALGFGLWSALAAVRARRRRDRAALVSVLRRAVLATSCLAALSGMEVVSGMVRWRSYRIPQLPTRFAGAGDRRPTESASGQGAATPLYLVVVGESSARGEPYHPWISVGQVVAWQLERVFPGREVRVEVRASGGVCLEQAVLQLADLGRRPDALIVFSGHNEFQARYGWSRNVRLYPEEGPESRLALLDLGRSSSATIYLILETLDRYYGETPPPPRVTRELVDHPTCTPWEYAFLRDDFRRRLDALAAYCRRIGTLPILIVPGSNDGDFEPSRSVLSGSTRAADRAAFERAFLAARAAEADDPEAAIAAYRRLVGQHPEFAECHYRLARLLARAGAGDEAGRQFILARDLDDLPLRCPSDFRDAIRTVAGRHGGLLIDGPELLARMCRTGVADDQLFHDAQHLNLAGTAALAQEILEQLRRRRAFGWPESTPVPRNDLEATARHFGMDVGRWATICRRSSTFYARTAYTRYDPSERLEVANRYEQAARALDAGQPLRPPGIPSLQMPISILEKAARTAAAAEGSVTGGRIGLR